jgi:hypothetical protein
MILLLAAGTLLVSPRATAEVYRWVDENGEVHYSESLPPDHQDKRHDILNESGIVVDEDQSLTPEPPPPPPKEEVATELPRDSSGMARPKPLYSDLELQKRMDSFLMLRYDSEQEIIDAMNVEIKQLAYDQRLLETSRGSLKASYRGQVEQAAHWQRAGRQINAPMSREIDQLRNRLADNEIALEGLKARENNIRADFQKQIERYRHLLEEWAKESAEG